MHMICLPTDLHIGTSGAYSRGEQYKYCWEPTRSILMCNHPTEHGSEDEKLVIEFDDSGNDKWYVAVEGSLTENGFAGRRTAFRTQKRFWIEGWHDWEVNQNFVAGVPDWSTEHYDLLPAETRVPPGSSSIALFEGLQQFARTH